jgi:hypothetical protein
MRDEQGTRGMTEAVEGLCGGGSGNSRRQKPRSRPALTVIIAGQRPTEADTPSAARTATLSQAQAPGVPLSLAGAREAASVPLRAADPVSFPPVKREDILGLTATLSAAEPARGHPYRERPYSPLLDTAPGFCGRADRRPAALGALGRGRGAALHRLRDRADGPRWPAETSQAVNLPVNPLSGREILSCLRGVQQEDLRRAILPAAGSCVSAQVTAPGTSADSDCFGNPGCFPNEMQVPPDPASNILQEAA